MGDTSLTDALRNYQLWRRAVSLNSRPSEIWRAFAAADALADALDARLADIHNQVDRQLLADVQAICDE